MIMTSYDYVTIAYALAGGAVIGFSLFVYLAFHRVSKLASDLQGED